jgi:uncharacterized protein YbbC (DUF1343 family)
MTNNIVMIDFKYLLIATFSVLTLGCAAQTKTAKPSTSSKILPAAERLDQYLPLLKGKNIAVFANQTSMVGTTHLVDTLKKLGVNITVIFGPEHGFRGTAEAGASVEGKDIDKATGLPVVSLYGNKRKPSQEDLKGVNLLLFDIQDVGVRFYTYISSLQDYMETALANNLPLVVLDRPNPNGFYVDGPVMEEKFKSFLGMQPIPVVYGMTIGEYAQMILHEQWLSKAANAQFRKIMASRFMEGSTYFQLIIIPCGNYTHKSKYVLPVRPSPNLPEIQSVYWYPSTCFFEATVLSEGRGTEKPFQIFGHPSLPKTMFAFVPEPRDYAKEYKPYGKTCYGWNLHATPEEVLKKVDNKLQLKYFLEAYRLFPKKDSFFILPKSGNPEEIFFNRLAGNATLMQQIKKGIPEKDIRKSWEPRLKSFKKIRKKYLMYPDFE